MHSHIIVARLRILFWVALLLPSLCLAVTFPTKPDAAHFHVDGAGLLLPADAERIDQIASNLLQEQGIALLVVTINSRVQQRAAQLSIERYAADLFNEWGIGSQAQNYGILLLVSRGDREARIEFGADWAGRHDADADYIMQQLILPEFRADRYSAGILAGVQGLDALARGLGLPRPKTPSWLLPALILGFVLGMAGVVSLWRSGRKGWAFALLAALGVLLMMLLRSKRDGGGGGSGGGFGGGSSGGGGSTGRW